MTNSHYLTPLIGTSVQPKSAYCTRVLLGKDEPFSLIMLQFFLGRIKDIEVIGCVGEEDSLIESVSTLQPDIVLFNLELQDVDELKVIRTIVEKFTHTQVLVLSHHKNKEFIQKVLEAGARGVLFRDTLVEEIIYAIRCLQKESSLNNIDLDRKLQKNRISLLKETPLLFSQILSKLYRTFKGIKKYIGKSSLSSWIILLSALLIVILGGGIIFFRTTASQQTVPLPKIEKRPMKINALGRLEPKGEVIHVSAPGSLSSSNAGSRVVELRVQEGDNVQKGQIIAVLDSRDRLAASLMEAKQQVAIAQRKLAQIRSGAKQGEINARQSTVNSLQAELAGEIESRQMDIARLKAEQDNAQAEANRYQPLHQAGAVSASEFDRYQLTAKTAQEKLNTAKAQLNQTQNTLNARIQEAISMVDQVAEVRPTDIALAQAEIEGAIVTVMRLEEELAQAYIRAPQNSQILRIHARAGERIGEQGVVELGQTDPMIAVAEIYESDLLLIKTGQMAIITSSTKAFPNPLQGKVMEIGYTVAKQDVLDTDPTAANDARVVEVKIQLDPPSSRQVIRLTNAQVNVEITL
jgi:HlyD family secretion protein